jgi:hypothetical protein
MGLDSWLGIVGRAFRCRTVPSSQGSLQLGRGFRNGETPPSNRAFHKLESSRSRRPTHQWMAIFADNSQGSLLCAQFTLIHGHLLMTVSALNCSMGDKTQKEKHKKDLQREAKRKAAEHKNQQITGAQHHPISGHPATAEHPASSGTIEVKGK